MPIRVHSCFPVRLICNTPIKIWRTAPHMHHLGTSLIFLSKFLSNLFHELHDNSPTHQNHRELLTGKVPNMPRTNARADARVKKAVSFLQKCPAATVKEGMLIAGFSKKEIEDRAKQAWIYRHPDKADSAANVPPPESIAVTESAGGEVATTMSSVLLLSPSNRRFLSVRLHQKRTEIAAALSMPAATAQPQWWQQCNSGGGSDATA